METKRSDDQVNLFNMDNCGLTKRDFQHSGNFLKVPTNRKSSDLCSRAMGNFKHALDIDITLKGKIST